MADENILKICKYILIVVVIIFVIASNSNAYLDNMNMPCKYLDSINITSGSHDHNDDSITFEGINYTKNLYALYDYEFLNESYRQPAIPHRRGCTCNLGKPCIRMCCPRGQIRNQTHCFPNDDAYDLQINVTINEENFTTGNLFDIFHYVVGRPCLRIIIREPETYPDLDSWVLLEDGSVRLGISSKTILNKNNYCLNPMEDNDSIGLALITCFEEDEKDKDFWIPYGMFTSVPFLVVTILVYILLPELRNVHGKSLVCYLLGLTVGYITLGWIKLNGSVQPEAVLCRTLGYVLYFSFMSAFFWLSVISFDLWWSFRGLHGVNNFTGMKKFIIYSVYAWGSTIFMAVLCYLIDASSIPTKFQPGMGVETCFLKKMWISEFLYLYLPIFLIITCNSTFFVLTARKIHNVQKEMSRVAAKDSQKHQQDLDEQKANIGLFFRLFILMGVTWSMEAISWLISRNGWYFYLTDLINAIQGVVIFFLFVMKPKVKELIIKRWNVCRGKTPQRNQRSTSTTQTSTISMNPINSSGDKSKVK